MKTSLIAFVLVVGAAACGSDTEGTEDTTETESAQDAPEPAGDEGATAAGSGEEAAPAAGEGDLPSVGDSCDVGAASALMACNGQQLLFCSSYSNFAWQETQVCPEGTTCTVSEDMTSGSCE